jgi:HK97 family phage prohead protease
MPYPEVEMGLTRSFFDCEGIELRAEGEKKILRGYAAVFDKLSKPLYGFREKIKRGAFKESVKNNNIRALWNHNTDMVLGSTKNNTLRLEEDDKGLKFEIDLPDTQYGRDAAVSVSRGDVDGMSFAFNVKKQEWDEEDLKNVVRTLVDVDLHEVSPTAFPAYSQTKVTIRSVKEDYDDYFAEQLATEEKQKTFNKLELHKTILTVLEKEYV